MAPVSMYLREIEIECAAFLDYGEGYGAETPLFSLSADCLTVAERSRLDTVASNTLSKICCYWGNQRCPYLSDRRGSLFRSSISNDVKSAL